jgi:hypothetical protein
VTTLYLGFRRSPQLSLYECVLVLCNGTVSPRVLANNWHSALVVVYLLLCSWTAIFFTLPRVSGCQTLQLRPY